jgi:predicted nucleic acid-binding Zn ribbon protein
MMGDLMPVYAYYCADNGLTVEVVHSMKEDLHSWSEVCKLAGRALGDTAADAKVERMIYAVGLALPTGDAKLKELGFTKLVRRDKGVYENVTAHDGEKKYMTSDDASSVPKFSDRIGD